MKIKNFNSTEIFIKNYNGQKLVIPKKITIKLLQEQDINNLYQLQNNILQELGDKQTLINKHSKQDFKNFINDGLIVGAFDKNKIIGTITFKQNHDFEVKIENIDLNKKDVGCLSSLMIKKEYRNNKLTQNITKYAIKTAKEQFKTENFISYIDADNPSSYKNFQELGFGLSHAYFDPYFKAKSYAFIYTTNQKVKKHLLFNCGDNLKYFGYIYALLTHKHKKEQLNLLNIKNTTKKMKFMLHSKIKG